MTTRGDFTGASTTRSVSSDVATVVSPVPPTGRSSRPYAVHAPPGTDAADQGGFGTLARMDYWTATIFNHVRANRRGDVRLALEEVRSDRASCVCVRSPVIVAVAISVPTAPLSCAVSVCHACRAAQSTSWSTALETHPSLQRVNRVGWASSSSVSSLAQRTTPTRSLGRLHCRFFTCC
jgi:hypothetical protein